MIQTGGDEQKLVRGHSALFPNQGITTRLLRADSHSSDLFSCHDKVVSSSCNAASIFSLVPQMWNTLDGLLNVVQSFGKVCGCRIYDALILTLACKFQWWSQVVSLGLSGETHLVKTPVQKVQVQQSHPSSLPSSLVSLHNLENLRLRRACLWKREMVIRAAADDSAWMITQHLSSLFCGTGVHQADG